MNGAYIWLIIAFALMAAEIAGTDFFLMFLGGAALFTAVVTFCADISFSWQCIVFGIVAMISVILWLLRYFIRIRRTGINETYQPNAGHDALKGLETQVTEVGSDGSFKIAVKDSVCLASSSVRGVAYQVGERVRVVSIDPETSRPVVEKIS
ncbi:MAG: NfeD family protein [Succinivibrionaceae bacterium]|nr:NfeD family protein [Succinivibrionaceae bacterium]